MIESREIDDVVTEYAGRSRLVLEYARIVGRVLQTANDPGFSVESWAPLAELVDTDRFERIGNFKDVMNWSEYVQFLVRWAPTGAWECSFKRISEVDRLVVLELEERTSTGGTTSAANSISVYAFDKSDRIHQIDVYLQIPMPREFLPSFYEDVRFLP